MDIELDVVDITPEDSVVPVYLEKLPPELAEEGELWELELVKSRQELEAKQKARESAILKLAKLGLTEDEFKSLIP